MRDKGYKYVRNIDDYSCYLESVEKAEHFILDLSTELKKFELRLNSKKTKINQLPKSSVANWVNKLNNFSIGEQKTKDGKQVFGIKKLKSFMDLSIELMLQEKDSAVLNYAVKVVSSKHLGEKAKSFYIKLIHHLVLLYPYLIHLVEEHLFESFDVSMDIRKEFAHDIYKLGLEKRTYEASSYSLFWGLKYNFKLDAENITNTSLSSNDCIFMLLGFLTSKRFKEKTDIKKFRKKALELKVTDLDRFWLFIYEALTPSKLGGEFKRIKNAKVSFVEPKFRA